MQAAVTRIPGPVPLPGATVGVRIKTGLSYIFILPSASVGLRVLLLLRMMAFRGYTGLSMVFTVSCLNVKSAIRDILYVIAAAIQGTRVFTANRFRGNSYVP